MNGKPIILPTVKSVGETLRGDLILRGGGDPFLTVERLLGDILALRQRGIKNISGRLLIDNSRFAKIATDRAAFDDQPTRLYNVEPDAALTNFAATNFIIEAVGGEIKVRAEPPLAGLIVRNKIKPHSGKCVNPKAGWTHRITRGGDDIIAHFAGEFRTHLRSA